MHLFFSFKTRLTLSVTFLAFVSIAQQAEKIQAGKLENFHRVDQHLYRSEQPQSADFTEMEKLGIKTVIDLRNRFDDHRELKNTNLIEVHIPINSWKIDYSHFVQILKAIHTAKKPVLVHCLHGADRTGCAVACYRMVFCNWTKEDAIREFLDPKFGYHDGWFPRMKNLLESVNPDQLRNDVLH